MFEGYLSFAGTEIINAERTKAYGLALLPTLRLSEFDAPNLNVALDDPPYTTPAADPAPWYDPDVVGSDGFLGFYPATISGLSGSSRTATVEESTGDGGFIYRVRRSTKSIRVRGLLIGTNRESAEVGLSWLKSALDGSACVGCEGDDLCFLIDAAATDAEWQRKARVVRNVTCTFGPEPIRTYQLSCGGWGIEVDFVLTATIPWTFGLQRQIANAEGATLTSVEPGALIAPMTTMPPCTYSVSVDPLLDPDCEPVPEPPVVPDIASGCGPEPASWFSYSVLIPKETLHSWTDAVPIITIRTGDLPARHVRIRFIPRIPETYLVADLDPCSACSAFDITYIPPSTRTVVDGMRERVEMQRHNGPAQDAEHLVEGIGADVFEWPVLSCGIGYYMVVDVDVDTIIGLDLHIADREQ